jgi:hypothetical protein
MARPFDRTKKMQIRTDARDYMDARASCGRLLSEAAFGDSPAREACAKAGVSLATIASWSGDASRRQQLRAA